MGRVMAAGTRTGIVLRDPLSWPQMAQVVTTAEDTGYDAVFVPEIAGREAFSTLAALAEKTSSMILGTGVVPMTSRTPLLTAMAAATVQELSAGRLVLGIGSGSRSVGTPVVPNLWPPLARFREYVRIVKEALSGRVVRSEASPGAGFRLEFESDALRPEVWIGALGDRMVAVGGEISEGVILNWCTPERVAEADRTLGEAAERAGRDRADITIAVYVRACLGVQEEAALAALKAATAQYASFPQYARQFERMGLGAEASVAAGAFRSRRTQEVPESLVRAVAVTGGRDEALSRFDDYRRAGADLVLCYPVATLDPFSSILGTVLAAAPSPAVAS